MYFGTSLLWLHVKVAKRAPRCLPWLKPYEPVNIIVQFEVFSNPHAMNLLLIVYTTNTPMPKLRVVGLIQSARLLSTAGIY